MPGTELGKKREQLWPGKKKKLQMLRLLQQHRRLQRFLFYNKCNPKSQLEDSWKNLESIFGNGCSETEVRKTLIQVTKILVDKN